MLNKLKEIANGWKNYVFENAEVERLAHERATICASCEHAVHGMIAHLMSDNTLEEIEGLKCDLCDCPLSTKCRSMKSKCDLALWDPITS